MSIASGLTCLTGATGYIGGRLLAMLEDRGRRVRCLTRRPEALQNRVGSTTEVARADVSDRDSLSTALDGVQTAYYPVHNMGSGDDFEQRDREGAANFAGAAQECGVKRIIYLGGLGDPSHQLSAHLRSRQEVGEILRRWGLQVIEFRASIVIGSGSLSFELIRSLVERLPVMVCPKWVSTPAQPIAIEDLLEYLLGALALPAGESRVFGIGGPDQVSYGDIMREYARQRGLRRRMISVSVLTPYLSSLWLGLVTPVYARTGRKLIEGLRNPTVVRDACLLKGPRWWPVVGSMSCPIRTHASTDSPRGQRCSWCCFSASTRGAHRRGHSAGVWYTSVSCGARKNPDCVSQAVDDGCREAIACTTRRAKVTDHPKVTRTCRDSRT